MLPALFYAIRLEMIQIKYRILKCHLNNKKVIAGNWSIFFVHFDFHELLRNFMVEICNKIDQQICRLVI